MVSRNIKVATKKKFKEKVSIYKRILRENSHKIDVKYFKQQTNLSILDARLKVLYEKGMFKNPENAKKIIRKYQNIINITNKIFLSRTKEIAESKILYSKDPNIREKMIDKYVIDHYKNIKELSKKGLEVNFIEEMTPIIDSFIKKNEKKIKDII